MVSSSKTADNDCADMIQTSSIPSIRSEQILSPKHYVNISIAKATEHYTVDGNDSEQPSPRIPYFLR